MSFREDVAATRKKLTKEEFEVHGRLTEAERQNAFSTATTNEALREYHAQLAKHYAAMEGDGSTESAAYVRLKALEAGPTLLQKFFWGAQNLRGPLGFFFGVTAWILRMVFGIIKTPLAWLYENIGIGYTPIVIPALSFLWLTFFAAYYGLGLVFFLSLLGNLMAIGVISLAAEEKPQKKNPLGMLAGFLVVISTLGVSFWKTPIASNKYNIIIQMRDGRVVQLIDNAIANFCDAPSIFRGDNFIYHTPFSASIWNQNIPFKHGRAKFNIVCDTELNFEALQRQPLAVRCLEDYEKDLERRVLETTYAILDAAAKKIPNNRTNGFTDQEERRLSLQIQDEVKKISNPLLVVTTVNVQRLLIGWFDKTGDDE